MLGHLTYYNGTIRKYVAAFGDVFNDIKIIREGKEIPVPISFLPKSKWYVLSTQRQIPGNDQSPLIQVKVPRMAFNISSISFDSGRMRPRNNAVFETVDVQGTPTDKIQYTPVPYNLTFQLSILTENITDQLQIVEQILPFFTPTFNLSIKDNPLNQEVWSDITLKLDSTNLNMDVEGNFDERRMTSAELEFTLRGIIYGPVEEGSVIREVTATTRDFAYQQEIDNRLQRYNVVLNPRDVDKGEDYGITESSTDFNN